MLLVYVTCPDATTAQTIGRAMVAARLAACANILGPIQSIYHWEGAVQEGAEVLLLIKTREELFESLRQRIISLHPYQVPCIVAWPITMGHPAFLQWIHTETTSKEESR
jgi:periplasmic divalent cation tolerance protein